METSTDYTIIDVRAYDQENRPWLDDTQIDYLRNLLASLYGRSADPYLKAVRASKGKGKEHAAFASLSDFLNDIFSRDAEHSDKRILGNVFITTRFFATSEQLHVMRMPYWAVEDVIKRSCEFILGNTVPFPLIELSWTLAECVVYLLNDGAFRSPDTKELLQQVYKEAKDKVSSSLLEVIYFSMNQSVSRNDVIVRRRDDDYTSSVVDSYLRNRSNFVKRSDDKVFDKEWSSIHKYRWAHLTQANAQWSMDHRSNLRKGAKEPLMTLKQVNSLMKPHPALIRMWQAMPNFSETNEYNIADECLQYMRQEGVVLCMNQLIPNLFVVPAAMSFAFDANYTPYLGVPDSWSECFHLEEASRPYMLSFIHMHPEGQTKDDEPVLALLVDMQNKSMEIVDISGSNFTVLKSTQSLLADLLKQPTSKITGLFPWILDSEETWTLKSSSQPVLGLIPKRLAGVNLARQVLACMVASVFSDENGKGFFQKRTSRQHELVLDFWVHLVSRPAKEVEDLFFNVVSNLMLQYVLCGFNFKHMFESSTSEDDQGVLQVWKSYKSSLETLDFSIRPLDIEDWKIRRMRFISMLTIYQGLFKDEPYRFNTTKNMVAQ